MAQIFQLKNFQNIQLETLGIDLYARFELSESKVNSRFNEFFAGSTKLIDSLLTDPEVIKEVGENNYSYKARLIQFYSSFLDKILTDLFPHKYNGELNNLNYLLTFEEKKLFLFTLEIWGKLDGINTRDLAEPLFEELITRLKASRNYLLGDFRNDMRILYGEMLVDRRNLDRTREEMIETNKHIYGLEKLDDRELAQAFDLIENGLSQRFYSRVYDAKDLEKEWLRVGRNYEAITADNERAFVEQKIIEKYAEFHNNVENGSCTYAIKFSPPLLENQDSLMVEIVKIDSTNVSTHNLYLPIKGNICDKSKNVLQILESLLHCSQIKSVTSDYSEFNFIENEVLSNLLVLENTKDHNLEHLLTNLILDQLAMPRTNVLEFINSLAIPKINEYTSMVMQKVGEPMIRNISSIHSNPEIISNHTKELVNIECISHLESMSEEEVLAQEDLTESDKVKILSGKLREDFSNNMSVNDSIQGKVSVNVSGSGSCPGGFRVIGGNEKPVSTTMNISAMKPEGKTFSNVSTKEYGNLRIDKFIFKGPDGKKFGAYKCPNPDCNNMVHECEIGKGCPKCELTADQWLKMVHDNKIKKAVNPNPKNKPAQENTTLVNNLGNIVSTLFNPFSSGKPKRSSFIES